MKPVIFALDERLANPGDTLSVTGHLDEPGYELGEHEFELPSGIDYDLALTNAGEGILATGMLRCHVKGTCDRCLEGAEFDIAGEVDEYYLFEEPADAGDDSDDDDIDFALVNPDETIDLAEALQTSLIMETPFVVLCKATRPRSRRPAARRTPSPPSPTLSSTRRTGSRAARPAFFSWRITV